MSGETVFKTLKMIYEDTNKSKLDTKSFLETTENVMEFMALFGTIFAQTKYEMGKNIESIKSVYEKDPENYKYLGCMILEEKSRNENVAVDGLLWLKRHLNFLLLFLEIIVSEYRLGMRVEDFAINLIDAYGIILQPYHPWMVQKLYAIVFRFKIPRIKFFRTLANYCDIPEEKIIEDMHTFTVRLRQCVDEITIFYDINDLVPKNEVY